MVEIARIKVRYGGNVYTLGVMSYSEPGEQIEILSLEFRDKPYIVNLIGKSD